MPTGSSSVDKFEVVEFGVFDGMRQAGLINFASVSPEPSFARALVGLSTSNTPHRQDKATGKTCSYKNIKIAREYNVPYFMFRARD